MASDQPTALPPCVLHEDEHLLVVNKPAGWNTHAPSPYAGEGIYDWLKHREPRWARLAIIHRLDKETSGVLVFGKTPLANRSLTEQFAGRAVQKKYLLLSDRAPKQHEFTATSKISRAGERYVSGAHGDEAETHFRLLETDDAGQTLVEALPRTGRTHQIRVHAAENGFPIIGDTLYGGVASQRVCLHASELRLQHPGDDFEVVFHAPHDFPVNSRDVLRDALISEDTNAYRLLHGSSDGPTLGQWYVERLGDYLLSSSPDPLALEGGGMGALICWMKKHSLVGAYHKTLSRHVRRTNAAESSPQLVHGQAAPERFSIRENGVQFELSFNEGYSVGLFLDQRDNRRRFLTGHIAAGFPVAVGQASRLSPSASGSGSKETGDRRDACPTVLNCFAYTCGFSVCAALAGAHTTSLDLSKKYLEWGKRNFTLNGLDPAQHDFIYGDTFDWLRRLAKKHRAFEAIILDPPTFSQSKESGVFRAEKDYGKLIAAALPVLKPGGVLLAATNAAELPPEKFLDHINEAVRGTRRKIVQQHYIPQPPDFPISRAEPAYLKTVWLRVS